MALLHPLDVGLKLKMLHFLDYSIELVNNNFWFPHHHNNLIPRKLPYIQFNNTFYLNNSIYKTKTHPIKNKIATINKISFLILSGNNKKILPSNCNIKELSPIAGI